MSNQHKSNSSPAIFLTGVTGFVGGAFLAHLLDSSFDGEVTCLVRADDQEAAGDRVRRSVARFGWKSASGKLPRNVKVLRGDLLSDEWHTAPELANITHVLHLAASTSFGNHPGIPRTNVGGALSVATAMRGRRLERYIHTGTATICGGDPPNVVHEDDYPSKSATHLLAYTRSKAEAERQLLERYSALPIVFARPSIVVGDTRFGCKPSGSIFWVLRAFAALKFIAWDPKNRVDVVPVDWAAAALAKLLFAPSLEHNRYHVSAGTGSSITWDQVSIEYARICGGPSSDGYEKGDISQLTSQRVKQAIGHGHARHLLHALELYSRFCSLDLVFDNSRILAAGVPAPPRFTDYMHVCLGSSTTSIYEQMRVDLEPTAVVA